MAEDTARIDGYAAAVLEVARAEGDPDGVPTELAQVARAFETSEQLLDTLRDPLIPLDRKKGVIDDVIAGRVSVVSVSLVNLLVATGRLGDLAQVARRAIEMAAARQQAVVAEIRTAFELDAETSLRLTEKLSAVTGKKVQLDVVVDSSLIGGVVAKVGDTIYDGSVRNRLQDLRESWG